MYLIDRSLLMKAVSEADRVLKDNGFLVITDFDPIYPFKNKYLDMDQIHSYKADYSKLFLANPSYSLVEKVILIKVLAFIEMKSKSSYLAFK